MLLLIAAGLYVYFFGGPYRFVGVPLAEKSMEHLRPGLAAALLGHRLLRKPQSSISIGGRSLTL